MLAAEERHARVDRTDVTEHARAQADAIEGVAVPAHGVLVGGARGHVLVGHWRHATPRPLLEFRQAQDVPAVGVGMQDGLSMGLRPEPRLDRSQAPRPERRLPRSALEYGPGSGRGTASGPGPRV